MPTHEKQLYGLTILQHCGSGAYGDVYYCHDISMKRLALKVISKSAIGSGWERELQGITNYRKLSESLPGLLQIFHTGADDDAFYYTMEPADNAAAPSSGTYLPDTLARRLSAGPLPSDELLSVLRKLLQAIALLHQAGYAHRDIKPENILFVHGQPKLGDLGLLSPLSGTMSLAGTLDFIPPEQRTSEALPDDSRESRQRSDLYAFGKVIYCSLTGCGADLFPSVPPTMPMTLVNKLFLRLSRRLCDREPSRRLTSMRELTREFEHSLQMCLYGESLHDKLHYATGAFCRQCAYAAHRCGAFVTRHCYVASLLFCSIGAGGLFLWRVISRRPDPATLSMAKTLQSQKETAASTQFTEKDFTFYNGVYRIAVPAKWQLFDHETILAGAGPRQADFAPIHGLFLADDTQEKTNASTVVTAMVFPVTCHELSALSQQELQTRLLQLIGNDIEAISLRHFHNQRLDLDTILLIGEARPGKAVWCNFYPRTDHTLALLALLPQERLDADLGKYLALTDSLQYRQ